MSFVLARVMDRQWAEKFVEGEIFMRSLSDFGAWNVVKNKDDATLANNFRGDISEGAVKFIKNFEDDKLSTIFSDDIKSVIKQARLIDNGIQYLNTLCLYCLQYDDKKKTFELPSPQLKNFGDTAIVINFPNLFLQRLLKLLNNERKYMFLLNRVKYYLPDHTKLLDPLFNKTQSYSWQNELRIAIGRLDMSKIACGDRFPLVETTDPLLLHIGSLRDIVQMVPIADFISGNWNKKGVNLVNLTKNTDIYVQKIKATEQIMTNYMPSRVNLQFSI